MIKTEDKRLMNRQLQTDTSAERIRDQGRIGQKVKDEKPENARKQSLCAEGNRRVSTGCPGSKCWQRERATRPQRITPRWR
jgi:hypothetical protein